MLGHFSHFLEQACAAPGTALDLLPMMDARETQHVLALAKGEAGVASHETTLVQLFEAQVERTPEAIALVFGEQRLSYRELNQRANQLAHHLRRLGVGPNVLVGLFLERSLEMVVGLYGILKAGGAYVPVDPEYPVDRVQFMIEDAAPAVLLIQARLAGQLPAYSGKIVRLDEDWARIAQEDNTNPTPAAGPDDSAYMIYTSGSTGMPKGALNSHRGICNRLIWMQSAYRLTPSDKVLQKTPFSFDVSVWEFFWPLEVGACMVIARPGGHREPEYLVQLIREQQVTVLHFVPSMLSAFLTDPGVSQCESLRHVICSGEALPFSLQEQFFAALPAQLHNLYGPTEAAVDVTHWTCERNSERSIVPIGRPVANTQIYILDGHGALVPIGVAGELYIGGVQVGMGYHKRPELSGEKFVADTVSRLPGQRLYRTGDLARYLPGGEVEYLGRLDHQVKIHGFRIELGEIEATLVKCPGVQEAVVVAREDQPGSKRLVAYLVAPGAPSQDAIREYLKQTLPEYMVPAAFVVLEQLPLSPNGKIDRKALPAPQYRSTSSAGPVAARTPVEKTLAGLWSKVLRVENVGIHDNFFELGGDSILSIQLISLARRDGLKLTAATLFANQTIAELASAVGTVEGPSAAASDKVTGGEVPLTPIQHWFFDQKLAQQEHFNQAYLLEVKQPLDRLLLARAAREVRLQHDALGLRFTRENQGWRQAYASGPEAGTVAWVPCADAAAMEEAARSAQASLNVETGPLWRIVYFDFGAEQPGRLLFVVHHLAVDGVSWGPLLEDLETAYQQLAQGGDVRLPARTSSFEAWAQRLQDFGRSEALRGELPYWQSVAEPARVSESLARLGAAPQPGQNTEASAATIVRTLTEAETRDLLQQVPAVYNTQINDVLLTALTRAWEQWSGSRVLFTNLEGHGREPLFDDADVSRTVGWFTSMFPVRLELPETGWAPGEALVSVKEQLRRIPRRGIGYGALRYLGDTTLAGLPSPQIVFNYFGQVDQLLQDSLMFGFAKESEGPWHSPGQTRAHILEINCRVIRGQLEVACAYSRDLHSESSIASFTTAITGTLRELIAHCQLPQAGRRTPSDFPLARLDQATLDRLIQGQDCEDLYPLTPIQTLFLSSDRGGASASFDQWHCTLAGDLQLEHFQRAWQATLERHPILRSTIHSEGLSEPLQMVHRHVQPVWTVEDWRGTAEDQQGPRWNEFLKDDIAAPLKLTDAPLMRFALRRLSENSWKFVWSVPALLLDGWSWPLVFSEVSQQYHAFETGRTPQLAPVRPYRDYVAWLQRQSSVNALEFWRSNLAGFREPTLIPSEASDWNGAGERYGKVMAEVPAAVTAGLQETARSLRVTLSTLVQGAWAMLLQRQSGSNDVVFGAAFSGRPADLSGAASITGPFVNNLPVRVAVDPSATLQEFFKSVHARTWELGVYQFTPVVEIQAVTEVPWRTRLFDSLVVFQNYLVDDTARRFGDRIEIREFAGPVHTNFPVLLLADPGKELRLSLIFDRQQVCSAAAGRWVRDLVTILEQTAAALDRNLAGVIASLSVPATSRPSKRGVPRPESAHLVPPQNDMERAIAGVWQEMFGIDSVSVDENFFDLGGHSLLLVQIHARLQAKLGISIPIVTLLAHPSIRALARHLAPNTDSPGAGAEVWRNRAAKQREALARPRPMVKR
jgi:amino acid adenylation domain-containing protein/non-ribosomal peptide synthase protein (TIGR01720 family)